MSEPTPSPPALPRRAALIWNATAGRARTLRWEQAVTALAQADPTLTVRAWPCEAGVSLHAALAQADAWQPSLLVAAGGDGTVGSVAALADRPGRALAVLPVGTRNHFARDLGLPADLAAAATVAATGRLDVVDVGDVNGRLFLNNVSLGVYVDAVRRRDRLRRWLPKWLAMPLACCTLATRRLGRTLRVSLDGHSQTLVTPLLLLGNNRYRLHPPGLGGRDHLDAGQLHVVWAKQCTLWSLLRTAMSALTLGDGPPGDLAQADAQQAIVITARRRLRAAIDGEPVRLRSPLHVTLRPRALRVRVPR